MASGHWPRLWKSDTPAAGGRFEMQAFARLKAPMQLSLTDLRLFVAVAELGNLTRAAERCHLSLPAVSNRIHALEDQARCRLLERQARGVALTAAGELFAAHARSMLLEADSLSATLSAFAGGLQGHVTLLANTTAVTELMPAVLAAFLAAHPQVSVSLQEQANHEIARAVREGRADLGVVAGDVDLGGLQARHFATDWLIAVCARSHPLAQRAEVSFAEVLEHPTVGMYEGSTIHDFMTQRIAAMGRPQVRPRVQVNSFEAVCLMAAAGVGVGIVPASAARRHGRAMDIAAIALTDAWAERRRHVVMRHTRARPQYLDDLAQAICTHEAPASAPQREDAPGNARSHE
jgi:DNA-binding transcriptional LysR family regulator